jgi:molybdopterin-dependent oxidoreductase alpha subunit
VLRKPRRRPTPSLWASPKPFGIGEQHPNNYREVARAIWENRDNAAYAWRILRHGCCDGCALGTKGLHDWTLHGTHLCNVRLRLLRLNTMGPLDPAPLADAAALRSRSSAELRELGRLPHPMIRRRGEPGFTRLGWDETMEIAADRIGAADPDRLGFYLTSRGMANESYYAVQKAVRALGTNSIDNAARVCHSPSTFGIKEALGVSATTCSYRDWIGTDLIVFIGSNVANNQPVATKYLHLAKKAGTRVATVNPFREPGMERYWVPSNVESALFGTKISDRFFPIAIGGDIGFLSGALKSMLAAGLIDRAFIDEHTTGFDELAAQLEALDWGHLEAISGTTRAEMEEFGRMVGDAERAVFVWSMGVTQHTSGEDNVRAILNLALSRGFVGREGCGVMPIRGHSGVQGGAELGCYATAFPGGAPVDEQGAAKLASDWGFDVPSAPGLTAPEMIEAAGRGELEALVTSGGNFLEVLPDPDVVREAIGGIPLRVHMDIVLSAQMLVEPADTVLLLPASTRYENPGGITETSTERRIIFSPEIPGPRIAEARPEWQVFGELAARARPRLAERVRFEGTAEIRAEIDRVVELYRGIAQLREEGDSLQYGGPLLCEGWRFPTADGRARFNAPRVPEPVADDGRLNLSTRRGKQFNSMVQGSRDSITGATREAVLISSADARRLGIAAGERVLVRSQTGELTGIAVIAPIAAGNVEVHWPEGNALIAPGRLSPQARIPDYNARVEVSPVRSPRRTETASVAGRGSPGSSA